MDLYRDTPELLTIDAGSGLAYFLDPAEDVVHVFRASGANITRIGTVKADGTTRLSMP